MASVFLFLCPFKVYAYRGEKHDYVSRPSKGTYDGRKGPGQIGSIDSMQLKNAEDEQVYPTADFNIPQIFPLYYGLDSLLLCCS